MNQRFDEDSVKLEDFGNSFLVICPACFKQAAVTNRGSGTSTLVVLACIECGHSEEWKSSGPGIMYAADTAHYSPGRVCIGAPVDWYFHHPLWLQAPCCGETLWAYNTAHLQFLEQYVGAVLRERHRDDAHGWSNQSLASRLPSWMKAAKNRDEIMKCLARLKQKLG